MQIRKPTLVIQIPVTIICLSPCGDVITHSGVCRKFPRGAQSIGVTGGPDGQAHPDF